MRCWRRGLQLTVWGCMRSFVWGSPPPKSCWQVRLNPTRSRPCKRNWIESRTLIWRHQPRHRKPPIPRERENYKPTSLQSARVPRRLQPTSAPVVSFALTESLQAPLRPIPRLATVPIRFTLRYDTSLLSLLSLRSLLSLLSILSLASTLRRPCVGLAQCRLGPGGGPIVQRSATTTSPKQDNPPRQRGA